eukprot:NODE_3_length_80033_cov_0.932970.p32 type:complete len:272 gc:universal NODE_3_length_80033_cov_0.932970:23453-24268(+)
MIRLVPKSLDLKHITIEIPIPKPYKFIFKATDSPLDLVSQFQLLGKVQNNVDTTATMRISDWLRKGHNLALDTNGKKFHYILDCSEIDNSLKLLNSELFELNRKIVIIENFNRIISSERMKMLTKWKAGGIGYLALQTSTLLWLTYAEQGLSWDVVEPITCLLGIATSIVSIGFYKLFLSDFTYLELFNKIGLRAEKKIFNSWHIQREFQKLSVLLDLPQNLEYNDFISNFDKLKQERKNLVSILTPWTTAKMLKQWKSIHPQWMPRINIE